MIYVAPERLETPRFLDFANHAEISMITVDEASLYFPVGAGFSAKLRKNPLIYPAASPQACGFRLYSYGHQKGQGRYPGVSGPGESL